MHVLTGEGRGIEGADSALVPIGSEEDDSGFVAGNGEFNPSLPCPELTVGIHAEAEFFRIERTVLIGYRNRDEFDALDHEVRVRPSAFLVYLHLAAESEKQQGLPVRASHQTIAELTGLSKISVQKGIRWLNGRKLLKCAKASATATPEYKVLQPWRR